jgi:serine protease Do
MVNGRTTVTQAQLRHILGRLYAGDEVRITVQRGQERLELAATPLLPPPRSQLAASLGILPLRDDPGPGIAVRFVFPGGPADQAGLRVGDRLLAIEGQPLSLPLARRLLSAMTPGEKVELAVRRGDGKVETVRVTLSQLTANLPPTDLPPGSAGKAPVAKDAPPLKTGLEKKVDPIQGRSWWVYVPEDARPGVTFGLLIWLHRPGEPMTDTFLQAWKELAAKQQLIIYAPQSENPTTWLTSEINPMLADVQELLSRLPIDRHRIVVHGLGAGATLAHFLAGDAPQFVRGVVAVNGALPASVKDPRAEQRLLTLIVNGKLDPDVAQWRAVRPTLVEKGFAVLEIEIDGLGNGYPLAPERLAEIARWIDAVDRL